MKRSRTASEAIFAHRMQPVARRIRFMVDQALAELGLSQATGWVLLHLARLGGEVPQSELAASLDMNGPGLVRLVDALEGGSSSSGKLIGPIVVSTGYCLRPAAGRPHSSWKTRWQACGQAYF
jgi:hypothetical protein